MCEEGLTAYIHQRLDELDKQTDMNEVTNKGRLSFGIEVARYQELPAWQTLLKEKSRMVKMMWITTFFDSLLIVAVVGDFFEKFEEAKLAFLYQEEKKSGEESRFFKFVKRD